MTGWDLNTDIPRPILSILEQQWPDVKLSVTNYDCSETTLSLLATPLLRSLRFKATPGPIGTYDKLDGYSKMPELREIMLNAPNLRKLHITFAAYWTNRNAADPHIIQLPLRPTDRLPPLHELTFSGPPNTYEWNLQHCTLLRQCMDWSRLCLLVNNVPIYRIWRLISRWWNKNGQLYRHAEALESFSRLVTVRVNVDLNFDASDFVAASHQDAQGTKPLPPFDIDIARKVTTKLFKGFFRYDPSARLEHLEVCFKYTQQDDRGQTYPVDCVLKMRRDRSPSAKSPVDGGYVMEGNGKWRGGYHL